jgi:hypothetical protein
MSEFVAYPSAKQTPIRILEIVKPDVEYTLGLDSIMTSELTSTESGVSDYSLTVMKGIDPNADFQFCPVALYKERPKTIYQAHETGIRLLQHYNKYGKAKITGELNAASEIFISMAISAGLKNCLLKRRDLSDKGYVDVKKFWFYRNDKILDWQIEACNVYLKKYGHMVWFREYLEDAQKPLEANKDALDSLMACLYGFGTGDLLGEKKEKPKVEAKPALRMFWEMKDGILQQVWK